MDLKALTKNAISDSCLVLLIGESHKGYRLAHTLYRTYGIRSCALVPKRRSPFIHLRRLVSLPFLRTIVLEEERPQLLADAARTFLESYNDTSAVPVLLDCTAGEALYRDAELCDLLSTTTYFTTADLYDTTAPFCYPTMPLPTSEHIILQGGPHDHT